MKIYKFLGVLLVSTLFLITSCDIEGEENIEWRPGDSLIIKGSTQVEVGAVDQPYYVEGFTVKKQYNWTVNGNAIEPGRGGEFVYLSFPSAGDYTIKVSNGTYEGTTTVTAVPPAAE